MGSAGRLLLAAVHACNLPRGTLVPSGVRAEKNVWAYAAPIQGRETANPASNNLLFGSLPGTTLADSIGIDGRHGCSLRIFSQDSFRNQKYCHPVGDAASPVFTDRLGAGIRVQRHHRLGSFLRRQRCRLQLRRHVAAPRSFCFPDLSLGR